MSIFSSLRYTLGDADELGQVWLALAFLPFGFFFDAFDGKVARWRKKSSLMGQELDSLADLVSPLRSAIARLSVADCGRFLLVWPPPWWPLRLACALLPTPSC